MHVYALQADALEHTKMNKRTTINMLVGFTVKLVLEQQTAKKRT